MNTPLEWSETKLEIFKALFAVQGKIRESAVKKTTANDYFHSKYADLSAVFDVALPILQENNILLVQGASSSETGISIETQLIHVPSGEWVRNILTLKPKGDEPQPSGSAITYGRRYGSQPLLAIAPEDDDGNAASGVANGGSKSFKPFAVKPQGDKHDVVEKPDSLTKKLAASLGAEEYEGVLESVRQNTDDNGVATWTSGYMDKKRFYTKDPDLGNEMIRFADCDCTITATRGTKANDFRLVSIK